MSKLMKCTFLFAVAVCLILAQPSKAQDGVRGNLVDVHWLEKNLKNPDILILDASPAPMYAAQHIPGAVNVNIFDLFSYGFGDKPVAQTEQLFQSLGISPGKKIVMYDTGGTYMASSLFFALDYHGFPAENLFVLDGGMFKWQKEGLPVTKDPTPAPQKGSFRITKANDDVRVELPEFLTGSGDLAHHVMVEALTADWHFGKIVPFDRAGHIPNGILAPSADFFNPDKTYKSPEEIKKMLAYLGVSPEKQVYTYCGGGLAASTPFFAARFIVNYPKVKLFQESELGWLTDPRGLPFWTYDAPYLMRESSWLQLWESRMVRTYINVPVTIVDVRPAAAFSEGHMPYALNISGDVFRSNLANPAKLAEILGPAGFNSSDEAVVFSGAGLTKDAALAFVILEKLGQKKLSIFMDSTDKWAKLGFPVTKDPTVVTAQKDPRVMSVTPAVYPTNFRKEVIISDAKSTQGAYPKVFIASGKDVPAKVPDGKVVHVPYTDLLNEDGTPKAAKDIWEILNKAGIPRYAELICFSDDPGEASVNYFILKLMGYPDIKVLIN